ncbi:MAG: hypothetical protein ACOC58_05185, partial [Chloroflexota bacterium]
PTTETMTGFIKEMNKPDVDMRHLLRRLQPYLVNLRLHERDSLQARGLIAELTPGIWQWLGAYDPLVGIGAGFADPEQFII